MGPDLKVRNPWKEGQAFGSGPNWKAGFGGRNFKSELYPPPNGVFIMETAGSVDLGLDLDLVLDS